MLVQFVLVVFAMCAVLSLIVDAGYARITQGQMQIAADTAALEGIRNRDHGVLNPTTGQTDNDAFYDDCTRRATAHDFVRWVFDDDMDPTNGDTDYQFGAGPIIDLTDGSTSLHALQTISVPETHSYKPNLQLNQRDNAVRGDMVSGRYDPMADYTSNQGADEDLNYARNDFIPNAVVPQAPAALQGCPPADDAPPDPWPLPGSGSLTGVDDSAFLVRLRRSNETTEPDVTSVGPSLPLLFGKGSTIPGDDATSTYSPRRDGLTVRATAIAEVRPALHIGLPQTGVPGVTPFALRDTFVQPLNAVGSAATVNTATGVICSGAIAPGNIGTCTAAAATAVGRLFVGNATAINAISTVGQTLPVAVALPPAVALACATNTFPGVTGYSPVYALMSTRVNRIIGFTRIGVGRDTTRAASAASCPVTISHGVPLVAPKNATAQLMNGLPLPVGAQPSDIRELLDRNCPVQRPECANRARIFPGVNYGPVLVPVLVR